jgi:serine/threonine protein phosphatase PrpC
MRITSHSRAQLIGGRAVQCDATAITAAPGGLVALAVVDGIGTSDDVRRFAQQTAHRITRAAVRHRSAEAGLRQVAYEVDADRIARRAFDDEPAACVLVALIARGEPLRLAWSGDVRAYAIRDDEAELLTRDHNWRRVVLDRGQLVQPGDRSSVTSCVGGVNSEHEIQRVCGHPGIETATVEAEEMRLLLATDGAYEPHEDFGHYLPAHLMGSAAEAAGRRGDGGGVALDGAAPDELGPAVAGDAHGCLRSWTG